MPDLLPYPEFRDDLVARQGEALLRLLRDDSPLRAFCNGGIEDVEAETVLLRGGVTANFLGLAAGPLADNRTGNANYGTLVTAWDLMLFTKLQDSRGTNRWLRPRVAAHVKRLLVRSMQLGEPLTDADGRPVADALLAFDRLDFGGRLRASDLIVTPLRIALSADYDQPSGEFIE